MTTSYWQRPFSTKSLAPYRELKADVVIVGGGYVGLSTAFWLSEFNSELEIIIVEREECGAGASGRNAGFMTVGSAAFYKSLSLRWGKDKALLISNFAHKSLELVHQHILASHSVPCERTSSMTLFQSEAQYQAWSHEDFQPNDFGFSWNDRKNLPESIQDKFYGAYSSALEYKINPMDLLGTLRGILTKRKVRIIENSSAYELTAEGIKTQDGFIAASHTVLALNGYLKQFHEKFSEVTPKRAQMMILELHEGFDCPHLYYDPQDRVYWRKVSNNLLAIGGKRLLDEVGENGDFEKLSPVIQSGLEDYVKNILGLKYSVLKRWSGVMGFTEHELPLIEKTNLISNPFIIGGFSGHGMGLGFHSAMEMAKLVLGMNNESFFSQFKRS